MKHPSAEPGPASQVKRIAAIVLAAGYSSRMGTLKPMLKIGDRDHSGARDRIVP